MARSGERSALDASSGNRSEFDIEPGIHLVEEHRLGSNRRIGRISLRFLFLAAETRMTPAAHHVAGIEGGATLPYFFKKSGVANSR